jgi:hypothetical protein
VAATRPDATSGLITAQRAFAIKMINEVASLHPTAALHLLLENCTNVLRPFQGEKDLRSIMRKNFGRRVVRPSINAIGSRLRRIGVFVWTNALTLSMSDFVIGHGCYAVCCRNLLQRPARVSRSGKNAADRRVASRSGRGG